MKWRSLLACSGLALGACSFSCFNRPVAVPPPVEQTMMSGVRYADLLVGMGAPAVYGSLVRIHYVGSLTNGERFDSSYDRGNPIAFTLGKHEVIRGFEDGVLGLRVGGKRKLTIPPELGYGEKGVPGAIPPNAELVFEVELVEVVGP